ncbi:TPA: GNAT family N-acetyltransferase, partial [Staphylococcus aureus]|nr:GNAT family N-acetyltransferase [Staphylococcus aureus]
MKAEIRHAEPKDLPEVIEMGREFFDQSGNNFTVFDEASFTATVIALMSGVSNGSLLVAESADRLVGMTACVVFPFYANMATKIGQEIFWFVKSDHRNGIGASLLDELEADARRRGADVFMSAAIAGLRDKAIGRVYEKRGYKPAENTYIRRLS